MFDRFENVPPLTVDEAARIIGRLEEVVASGRIVLIGGQAIAIWGSQLADYLAADDEPVTSRDVDFQGGRSDVELAAELLGGRLYIPSMDDATPQTGKVVFRRQRCDRAHARLPGPAVGA